MKPSGLRIRWGARSDRKIARPSETGTAITMAMSEVTTVP